VLFWQALIMEHRWGERIAVDVPIRLAAAHPLWARSGWLEDLSVSGAFIAAGFELRRLLRIHVILDLPAHPKWEAPVIAAYVARTSREGIGVEWCTFAPSPVVAYLRAATARRYHRPDWTARAARHRITRLSPSLLKHQP
jgi:hypothetical protein